MIVTHVANWQLDEILKKVNDAENVESELVSALAVPYVKQYLLDLLNEEWPTFDVEEIKWTNYKYHRSMAGAFLRSKSAWNIYSNVLMEPEVRKHTKEFQCKSLLEMLCEGEAAVLIAILTKNLQKLYPNITHELLNKVL